MSGVKERERNREIKIEIRQVRVIQSTVVEGDYSTELLAAIDIL